MRKFALILVWLVSFLLPMGFVFPAHFEQPVLGYAVGISIASLIASLVTWCIYYFWKDAQYAIRFDHRDSGICIHCAYDCSDFPALTCPECGKPHADHADAGTPSLPESNA